MNKENLNNDKSNADLPHTKPPEDYSSFDDIVSKKNFLNSMHKIPEGFQHFVDVDSGNKKPDGYLNGHVLPLEEIREESTLKPIKEKKSKKTFTQLFYITVVLIFCTVLFIVPITVFITEDKEFSQSENRVLAQIPQLSLSSITSGAFMKDFESYLTDQFNLRDSAISLKTFVDRTIGIRKENGVYIGKDGFLFDTPTEYNQQSTDEKAKVISEFTAKYPKLKKAVAISPNSTYIYSDKLPRNLQFPNQSNQLDEISKSLTDTEITFIDTISVLTNAKNSDNAPQLFYKTDHHWTTRGAYEVFKEITKQWSLDTKKINHYFYTLSDSFEGTLGSKSGVHDTKDIIEMCVPQKSSGSYVVNYESQQKKTATLFESEKLNQKNQYEVFLGGNFDKVIISTTCASDNSLLLVKDSYANCMIPMLTAHFSEIVVIDPRYLTDSMQTIMKEHSFTHILFLYNLNTFLEDTSLSDALSD